MKTKTPQTPARSSMSAIAVIGMGCHYPGACDTPQLWENILARRRQFRQLPAQRLPLSEYYDPDPQVPDKTYGNRAAVIDGFEFDWISKRIPKTAVESTDIVHWLALEVALKALEDAGYTRESVANERSGVVLGNTLTGEQTRSSTMRLRWPYVRRALRAAAKVKGLPPQAVEELVETMEEFYKSAFSPITEDTLAGGLSNTIAGRICNFLNFHGGGYTVDGACSSSLIAVATAATALTNGDLDLALAGGVDVSLDTFEMIGFAKTGALTSQDMTVYDRKASGFLPGEGCGFVVLKRLEDARASGDYVYAVLHGWGISSDGKGGITAPSGSGQAKALRRCYERSGYSPHELDFIEGHGTGTPVGDRIELEGIALAINCDGELKPRSVGVTSFKSLVGHTKAAAGIGGFIKAVMAVNQRVLPPTAGCKDPNPVFESFAQSLYPILQGEVRNQTETLRAGISAMGFGGINCHATIESGDAPAAHLKPSIEERALLVSNQETELFVLSAASVPELRKRVQAVMDVAAGMSVAELVDLAAQLSGELESQQPVRAAVIAGTPEELVERLQQLEEMLNDTPPAKGEVVVSPQKEIWIANAVNRSRVGFLFPGQGSQKLNMARTLVERYSWARELLEQADSWLRELGVESVSEFIYRPLDRAVNGEQVQEWSKSLARTQVAQSAICFASLLWKRYLERLGVNPIAVGGHSLGELTAVQASGAFDEKALLCLAAIRGQAMSTNADVAGTMASLSCSQETAEKLLQQVKGYVVVANINSPQQTVISGERSSVEEVIKLAAAQNIQTRQLPVSNAFHSQLVSTTAERLRAEAPIPEELTETSMQLFSSINGQLVQPGINLREHFANQVTAQVDFVSLVKAIASECDLFVEVGPGRVLSGLANVITEPNGPLCFPLESKPECDRDLNTFLGSFFVHGGEVNWEALYENRLVRPFIPASQRIFIENPCERPFQVSATEISPDLAISGVSLYSGTIRSAMPTRETAPITATNNTVAVVPQAVEAVEESVDLSKLLLKLVEERTGFPQETLSMDLRLLDDLNLDSIKAADLVATVAKQVGVEGELDPSTLANATLADVVAAIQKAQPTPQSKSKRVSSVPAAANASPKDSSQKLEDISNWVRNFAVEYMPQEAPQRKTEDWSKAKVLIVADRVESPVAKALGEQLLTQGAQVEKVTYEQVSADESGLPASFSHYLAVLPQTTQSEQESLPLAQMVARLKSIATPPKADTSTCVAYVQFGGGRFGSGTQAMNPEVCCAAAFARSLHLERSDLRIRVVDLAQDIEPNHATELVITELSGTEAIATVGYDADLVRLVPQSRLQQPANYSKRSLPWSEQDVILVTGGAKGITAECALALAQFTGVKMALVGRSPAPTPDNRSSEVVHTLERFQAEGLTCRYYSCDVANADAVTQLVETVTAELGAITGVIHGAGLNTPRRVEQVSLNAAQAEVSPKLLGAYNLLQALASTPPKLFIAFSSIIGVTGMSGNAWYGFANESLDIMLRRFESEHPETSVLSLAYSVWGEVGMGARMGSVKNLARMGIGAIPTEEGVGRFLKLFECDPGVKQVVIAARLGGLDTWSPVPLPPATGLRFIEQVSYVEPGVELKARTHLSLERDLYVQDHIWRGSYLFPTVFGLEAMAQATAYVTGEAQPQIVCIEDISLRRPVVVNPTTGVEIEVHAEVMEADAVGERRVKVSIRTEQTAFTTDHFAATLVLGEPTLGVKAAPKLGKALDLDPQTDLYGDLLFQGPRFQRMGSIFSLSQESSVFCSYVRSEADLLEESFAPNQGSYLVLGDPYFRDVLLQSVQLTIPQDICLPVHIDKIELFRNSSSDAGSRVVTVLLQKREGREYISEVVATDEQGYVVEWLTGYRLRILEEQPENPTAVGLAFPEERDQSHLHKVLTTTFKRFGLNQPAVALGYAPNLHAKSKKQRLQQELPIIACALRTKLELPPEAEIDFAIKTLSSGKPKFTGASTVGLDLSLSHCDRYCLCVVEETPQGCDIEAITHRTAEDWVALLSVSRSSVVDELVQRGDTRDRAATRIWSALEAIRKAFNGTNPEFSVVAQQGDGVLLQTQTPAGNYLVVTVPIKLTRPPERMVAIVIPQPQQQASLAALSSAPSTADRDSHRSRYTNDGPQGQLVYEQRFQASFKDSGSISRRVYFSQYFRWIGQSRELPMESIASQMLSDFLSGEWGMVTNAVSLRVLGEATSYDVIQARAWVGNVVGSSFDTYIEFCKVLPDDSLKRLAIAEVKATWVRLVSYGVPSPMPFPKYLEEYLLRFAAKQPATLDLRKPATLPLPPLPASLAQLDSGRIVYQTPVASNRYGKLLRSEVFQTTLEESNLVGNVYYGNYFIWQGRTLDLFLYSVAPEYLRVSNPRGEMICLYSRMDYLREAMPFDKIRVLLYVQSVSECGAVFNFEFFREQPDGSQEKLHVGQQEVAWVIRLDDGTPVAATWPPFVMQALVEMPSLQKVALDSTLSTSTAGKPEI